MYQIPKNKHLEPYFTIAEEEAKKSPCVRRQYGAVIIPALPNDFGHHTGYNQRVTTCCNNVCARDTHNLPTDGRHTSVEIGAEVHAETAAIINAGRSNCEDAVLVLAGYKGARELLWDDVWPCRVCALNIKYAGFKYIYVRNLKREITPISVAEIIEFREQDWEPDK